MYRIFCDSYKNYMDLFPDDAKEVESRDIPDDVKKVESRDIPDDAKKATYRHGMAMPLTLLCDVARYAAEKESETELYKQLSDLLYFMEQNLAEYPVLKAFLWTLESRGMSGKSYGMVSSIDLNEQVKLVVMLLRLMYWEEAV
jgi:hypothetical protein